MTATAPQVGSQLADEYEAMLQQYFEGLGEAALEYAYELGRQALADGLGVLDMARLHHAALLKVSPSRSPRDEALRSAETLLIESLTPFEMTHRGFRESYAALQTSEGRYRELFEKAHDQHEAVTRRIAHALHDEAGQMLASVYLAVADIARELPDAGRQPLEKVSELLDHVTGQLRHLSHELRPVLLDDLGLVPALEFLAQGIARRSGLVISVESSIHDRLPVKIETALYRILQEALINVSKHARATRACITLERSSLAVCSSIRDDGIGFDPTDDICPPASGGLGLIGMRERLMAMGGMLSITSHSDDQGARKGTTIEIIIPLPAVPAAEQDSQS